MDAGKVGRAGDVDLTEKACQTVSAASLKLWLDEIREGFGLEFWCLRSGVKLLVWRSVDGQAGDLGERTPAMEGKR